MLKQAAYFLAFFIILAGIFVFGEYSVSPVFESCIEQNKNTDAKTTTEKNPSTFGATIGIYVGCSGEFIEDHDGGITALATIIIAAFTGTLWVATTSQGKLTKEALVADKRAFVFAAGITPTWEVDPVTHKFNWRIRPVWQNTGDTPTKRMRLYVACEIRNTPLQSGFDFTQTICPPGPGMLDPKAISMGAPRHSYRRRRSLHKILSVHKTERSLSIGGDGLNILTYSRGPQNILLDFVG